MLMRICLVIAILAGLAVGGLNFTKIKEKVTTLQTNLATQTSRADKAEHDLASTRKDLDKTRSELTQTKATLDSTKQDLEKSTAENGALTKKVEGLNTELSKTRQDRDDAQRELSAYRGTGLTTEQIVGLDKQMKNLQASLDGAKAENKVLGQQVRKLDNELKNYRDPEFHVPLPGTLAGRVLVSDPKWNFVVLNVGENQGILEHGELLINRNGKLVAKVKVSSVQKDRCVANLMPGWKLGEVLEGDTVIPAYPAS